MGNNKKKKFQILSFDELDQIKMRSEYPEDQEGTPREKQQLRICVDRRNRKGKEVTLIIGMQESEEEILNISKKLKSKCGVGGTVKNNEIIIQGDFRKKIEILLKEEGFVKIKVIQ